MSLKELFEAHVNRPAGQPAATAAAAGGDMLVSVCMIVRNEARVLPAALQALAGRPDPIGEIVVADTGSTDGTQEIARAAGCRVLEVPWQDSFSHARNAALAAAGGRYCLMIDADEVVDAATLPALAAFLQQGACPLGRIQIVSATPDGLVREAVTRVCPNDGRYRYEGRVHEQIVGPGLRGDTGLVCHHSGYTQEATLRKGTAGRNLELLRLDLAEAPEDPYLHFQLGRTLVKRRPAEALGHFDRALSRAPADAPYLPLLVLEAANALRACDRRPAALDLVRRGRQHFPAYTDLAFLEGLLLMDLGDATGMVRAFQACLVLGEPRAVSSVEGVGTWRPHYNLGLFYELSGQIAEARLHYEKALAAAPEFTQAQDRLACLPV
jgi:hypothetical protein